MRTARPRVERGRMPRVSGQRELRHAQPWNVRTAPEKRLPYEARPGGVFIHAHMAAESIECHTWADPVWCIEGTHEPPCSEATVCEILGWPVPEQGQGCTPHVPAEQGRALPNPLRIRPPFLLCPSTSAALRRPRFRSTPRLSNAARAPQRRAWRRISTASRQLSFSSAAGMCFLVGSCGRPAKWRGQHTAAELRSEPTDSPNVLLGFTTIPALSGHVAASTGSRSSQRS